MKRVVLVASLILADVGSAVEQSPIIKQDHNNQPTKNVKYKAGKQVNFNAHQVQGELRRPDVSPVIGDESGKSNGILRLRENFMDKITTATAGEIE